MALVKQAFVLILVLMEDALVQANVSAEDYEIIEVLILVLMEDALVLISKMI